MVLQFVWRLAPKHGPTANIFAYQIVIINSSINFVIYAISSPTFRQRLKRVGDFKNHSVSTSTAATFTIINDTAAAVTFIINTIAVGAATTTILSPPLPISLLLPPSLTLPPQQKYNFHIDIDNDFQKHCLNHKLWIHSNVCVSNTCCLHCLHPSWVF